MGVWLEEEKIHGDMVPGRFMKGFVQGKGAERVLGAWGQGKDLCMKSVEPNFSGKNNYLS